MVVSIIFEESEYTDQEIEWTHDIIKSTQLTEKNSFKKFSRILKE